MTVRLLMLNTNNQLTNNIRNSFSSLEIDLILTREFSLAVYLAQKNLPELIICDDKNLADVLTLSKEIKNDPELSKTPIILLSDTSTESNQLKELLSLGLQIVPKDISIDKLCKQIEPYLIPKEHNRQPETTE